MGPLVQGYMYPNEVELQWSVLIVLYPFITGLVAGAFILASLVRSGVPILEVLQIVSQTVGNVIMEKSIRTAAQDIERGESISVALAKHPIFPSMIIRMVTAGEQTGKIDNMLERIADFLDEEIETTLSGITALIEPILIVFLGVVVGGMVICMFLPIFKMPEIVSGHR